MVKYSRKKNTKPKEVPNVIITLINTKINIENKFTCSISNDVLNKYEINNNIKFLNKSHSYKIVFNNKERELLCPIYINKNGTKTVVIPSLKIPRRKYPVYAYLYGVAEYLSSNKSMRKVAAEIRRKFGADTFSHSTLSRVLKKLISNLQGIKKCAGVDRCVEVVKRNHWTESYAQQALELLCCLNCILKDPEAWSACLAYDFFMSNNGQYIF